jgi:hypothetical protein
MSNGISLDKLADEVRDARIARQEVAAQRAELDNAETRAEARLRIAIENFDQAVARVKR